MLIPYPTSKRRANERMDYGMKADRAVQRHNMGRGRLARMLTLRFLGDAAYHMLKGGAGRSRIVETM